MSWRRIVPRLIVVLVVLAIAGSIGIRSLLDSINDNKCLHRCFSSLGLVRDLEDFKFTKGSYPLASDAAALKITLRDALPSSSRPIDDTDLLFESNGTSYRLAVFPNGSEYAGGYCGCVLVADRRIISSLAAFSAKSKERLAEYLEASLTWKSNR